MLSQDRDGGIPKVIANKISVLSTGRGLHSSTFPAHHKHLFWDTLGVSGSQGNKWLRLS